MGYLSNALERLKPIPYCPCSYIPFSLLCLPRKKDESSKPGGETGFAAPDDPTQHIADFLNSPEMNRKPKTNLILTDTIHLTEPNIKHSRLLQLPAEIRHQIWTDAFGWKQVHIDYEYGKQFAAFRSSPFRSDLHHTLQFSHRYRHHPAYVLHPCHLLRTCRQIYSDAISLLYSTAVFKFEDLTSLIFFSKMIRPERLAQIRTVHLVWRDSYGNELLEMIWPLACNILVHEMPGLRYFHLRLQPVDWCLEWAELLALVTQPLKLFVLRCRRFDGYAELGPEIEIEVSDPALLGKPGLREHVIQEIARRGCVF